MPVGVYIRSEGHKRKLMKVLKKNQFQKSSIPWNKGIKWTRGKNNKPVSKETLRKLSLAHKGQSPWNKGLVGSKSHSWKGGKRSITAFIRASEEYRQWRADVFKRDGWTCQTCNLRGHGSDIESHHIIHIKTLLEKASISEKDYELKCSLTLAIPGMFEVSNGITLCKDCHILNHKGDKNEKVH